MRRLKLLAPLGATIALLAAASAANANVPLTTFTPDKYTNTTSQHKTHVEPDTFAFGSTEVAAYQSGRFFDGGASGTGFATTTDNGSTWTRGFLPGTTVFDSPAGPYSRATDPAVAYDSIHNVWFVSTLGLVQKGKKLTGRAVLVSRSTDGGLTWGNPVTVATAARGQDFDKNWITCDNASSRFKGNCYVTFDDFGHGDLLKFSTSTDGGTTWGPALNTADNAHGLGGQPVVQPNGTVVVPASNASETAVISTRSTNGGTSWEASTLISQVVDHTVAASIRSGPLPTAEIDGSGKVYVVWQDCRFEAACAANDLVLSTSTTGTTWTAATGVPADDASHPNADQFIPGLGVDPTGHLALTYYYYDDANCGTACQLNVGYMSSADGGSTWSTQTTLAGPISPSWIADTSQGRMVGDYISTSFLGSTARPVFVVATAPAGSVFNELAATPTTGLGASGGTTAPIPASAAVVAPRGSSSGALHKVGHRE